MQSSGEVVIHRRGSEENLSAVRHGISLEVAYELEDTAEVVRHHGYRCVALQFPDNLLEDAWKVTRALQQRVPPEVRFVVLADTSYGSCCVDEIAAQHADADFIVHYGRTCLSPTRRLPVRFVFGRLPLDTSDFVDKMTSLLLPAPDGRATVVLCDLMYHYGMQEVQQRLHQQCPDHCILFPTVEKDRLTIEERTEEEDSDRVRVVSGQRIIFPRECVPDESTIVFVGPEGRTLLNVLVTLNRCKIVRYDPEIRSLLPETLDASKMLRRRYYLMERSKDAEVIGIVVGTLGVADYMEIIMRLKELIQRAGKKYYVFSMGKLNEAKLANIAEVDIFVIVACPENTMIDSHGFFKPVVTPFELQVALTRGMEWTGDYVTDFRQILSGLASSPPKAEDEEEEEEVRFSLITGKIHVHKTTTGTDVSKEKQLVSLSDERTLALPGASSYLARRSWRGLEQRIGETEVVKAVEGRRGTAAGYEEEGETRMP